MRVLANGGVLVCLVLAGVAPGQAQSMAGGTAELPKGARNALAARWSDWQPAQVDSAATACASGAPGGPFQIDVDGDGRPDLALAVRTADGVRLAILINRPWGYDVYDVDSLGDTAVSGYLSLSPRGTTYPNSSTSMNSSFYYDTLTVLRCGESQRVAYLWRGYGFERIVISAS